MPSSYRAGLRPPLSKKAAASIMPIRTRRDIRQIHRQMPSRRRHALECILIEIGVR
jgi:hypothetical protein